MNGNCRFRIDIGTGIADRGFVFVNGWSALFIVTLPVVLGKVFAIQIDIIFASDKIQLTNHLTYLNQ
jgi:hypothetical protein